jgi:hypothetical protein
VNVLTQPSPYEDVNRLLRTATQIKVKQNHHCFSLALVYIA